MGRSSKRAELNTGSAGLWRLLAGRLAQSIVTLWLVTVLFFVVIELLPGDFAVQTAGMGTSEAQMQATRERLGLDRPVLERYVSWLAGAIRGDFGMSWWGRQPISTMIAERLWAFDVAVRLGGDTDIAAGHRACVCGGALAGQPV